MSQELLLGKTLIEKEVRRMASELQEPLEHLEWGNPAFSLPEDLGIVDAGETFYPLALTSGAERRIVRFSQAELEDCGAEADQPVHPLYKSRLFDALSSKKLKRVV